MQASMYDILIVGGGMVGATLACALAEKTSLSIGILESKSSPTAWSAAAYHHRVSALSLSSQRIFQNIHLWEAMLAKRLSPFNQIQVWDEAGIGGMTFDAQDIHERHLGYIVENNVIQSALEEKLKLFPQVDWIAPVKLIGFAEKDNIIKLMTTDERVFKAKLAIAADGAHSWLRESARITVKKIPYDQEAIVATVVTTLPHDQVARQVFLETGPLAFLPLADTHTCSIVWSLPTAKAKEMMALQPEHFQRELAKAFSHRLGDVVTMDERFAFPLVKQQATQYVKSHVALVGDAAHTVHPLAGQGVNMGLLDAASLAEVMIDALNKGKDFASDTVLRRYERWRRADNAALLNGIDVIKNIFAVNQAPLPQIRSLGLNVTNRIPFIKNLFTRHAVGVRRGLPKLAE